MKNMLSQQASFDLSAHTPLEEAREKHVVPGNALLCVVLHCVALRCAALHCVTLRCVASRCVALRCALRCIAWHGIA